MSFSPPSPSSSSAPCCLPRTCCFGKRSVLAGARIVAAVDVVLQLVALAALASARPLTARPPSLAKTAAWPVALMLADLLLLNGVRNRRVVFLAIWQFVFLFHIFILTAVTLLVSLVMLPHLEYTAETVAARDASVGAVEAVIVATLVVCLLLLPFHVYSFRIVNGAKLLVAELQFEAQATQASRIMVRRHSEPHSSSLSQARLPFALLGVEHLSQSLQTVSKRHRHDTASASQSQWIHQDAPKKEYYSPNDLFQSGGIGGAGGDDSVPDLWLTQPISLHPIQYQDPMQPFMPAYPAARPGVLGSLGASNRVQPGSGFIMPAHVRTSSEI